ncbi:acetyltransferase [Bdellovibrio bacteriovorus]|uniref:Acetyltransferase n=1 Tax=Bdellovibrio bacteriovorus TaxID=959 RepID=A0A150WHB9_BDEBC|nr:GNAT family N-acetyltransferase [Bdellovibrio bacteriovorus]KYG62475.1 acetyltransferase [Bdellovibrio bacteriovorus]
MKTRPTLKTDRLILRPFEISDGPRVMKLAGDPEIAATTLAVPHPYLEGMAETWISRHQENFEKGTGLQFAIVLKSTDELIGCIDFCAMSKAHNKAEIGYWVGRPFWGQGYCSEACQALIKYGFEELKLNRIVARHMSGNPASGKVMIKSGMKQEGVLRQDICKNSVYYDSVIYGILHSEYQPK